MSEVCYINGRIFANTSRACLYDWSLIVLAATCIQLFRRMLTFKAWLGVNKTLCLGIYIINLKRTWEKLLLAARAIVAIENPADVSVISSRNTGQVCGTICLVFLIKPKDVLGCVEKHTEKKTL